MTPDEEEAEAERCPKDRKKKASENWKNNIMQLNFGCISELMMDLVLKCFGMPCCNQVCIP
jgi:hypothetical protein